MNEDGTPKNGNHVTWRELHLALKPINERTERMEGILNLLYGHWFEEIGATRERRKRAGSTRFWVTILTTLLAGALGAILALLFA